MNTKENLQKQAMIAAQEQGISSVLFRTTVGRKLGLNSTEWECLSYLSVKGVTTPTEIARYIGLTTGSTTTLLDRLQKAGFIRRTPNPHDRRGVLIEVDKKWQQEAGPLVVGLVKKHAEMFASYSADELKIIIDFLTRFSKNVTEHTKTIDNK